MQCNLDNFYPHITLTQPQNKPTLLLSIYSFFRNAAGGTVTLTTHSFSPPENKSKKGTELQSGQNFGIFFALKGFV